MKKFAWILLLPNLLYGVLTISNVSVSPNPFSPNGDGIADTAYFQFMLSGGNATIYLKIDGVGLVDTVDASIGVNTLVWAPSAGTADGRYLYKIYGFGAGSEPTDTASGWVIADTTPPLILNVDASPNPFTPNNDGITDYAHIAFDAYETYPHRYPDSLYFTQPLGLIRIWYQNGGTQTSYTEYRHLPDLGYPVYLYLYGAQFPSEIAEVTLTFIDYGSNQIPVTVEPNQEVRIGGLTNKFSDVIYTVSPIDSTDGEILLYVWAFTGNASITITDSMNNVVATTNFWEVFRGDGHYFTDWGPGPIEDGPYTYRIQVEDESYNTSIFIGTIIANSIPTEVESLSSDYPMISPINRDGNFDATMIQYKLSERAHVTVRIYNSSTVWDSTTYISPIFVDSVLEGGWHTVAFDGTDSAGNYLPDGEYTIVIAANDPITGDADRDGITIVVDNTPPPPPDLDSTSLTTPTGSPIDTLVGYSEPGSEVEIFMNGLRVTTVQADPITGRFELEMNFDEGVNRIWAVAYDEVKNASDVSDTLVVVYDAQPPYVDASFPSEGEAVSTTLPYVWVKLADAVTGVKLTSSSIVVRKEGLTVPGSIEYHSPDTLFYVFDMPLSDSEDNGFYSIYVTGFDSVNNMMADTLNFVFDNEAPSLTFMPTDSSMHRMLDTVRVYFDDPYAGVDTVNSAVLVERADLLGVVDTASGISYFVADTLFFIFDPPIRTDGSDDYWYLLNVNAYDKAGNNAIEVAHLLLDTRPPTVVQGFVDGDPMWSKKKFDKDSEKQREPYYRTSPFDSVVVLASDSVLANRPFSGIEKGSVSITLYDSLWNVVSGYETVSDNGDTLTWKVYNTVGVDGVYHVVVQLADHAGNADAETLDIVLDRVPPTVQLVSPADSAYLNRLDTVVVFLYDTVSGVDTAELYVTGEVVGDRSGYQIFSNDTLYFVFDPPLATDGSNDDWFTIRVENVTDHAGNVSGLQRFYFLYDTRPPKVVNAWVNDISIAIDTAFACTTAIDSVSAILTDDVMGNVRYSGLRFQSISIVLLDQFGNAVEGNLSREGDSDTARLVWRLNTPLTAEGNYTIQIVSIDSIGNQDTVEIPVLLDLTPPQFVGSDPADNNFVNTSPDMIKVVVQELGSGLVYDTSVSYIRVMRPDSGYVPGYTTFIGDTMAFVLINPLPSDGTGDGIYTIFAHARDYANHESDTTFQFIFDTQTPQVVYSIPTDGTYWNYTTYHDTLWIVLSDATSGLDFNSSGVSVLKDGQAFTPAGYPRRPPDSLGVIIGGFNEGVFDLVVTAYDYALNVLRDTIRFVVDSTRPTVEFLPDSGTVTNTLSEFAAVISDNISGAHPDSSRLVVTSQGRGAVGLQSYEWRGDTLVFHPLPPIATDGTDDGEFVIRAYAFDKSLNVDSSKVSTLIYDTRPPVILAYGPTDTLITDTFGLVWAVVTDSVAPRKVSHVDTSATQIRVRDELGNYYPGTGYWHVDTLFYELTPPIAQDGHYTMVVFLADSVGNTDSVFVHFVVDLNSPVVAWSQPAANSYVNEPPAEILVYIEDRGSGVNYDSTEIQLITPNGGQVVGHKEVRGDTVAFVIDNPLPTDGSGDGEYKIIVRSFDNLNRPLSPHNPDTIKFIYDTQVPRIVEVYPQDSSFLNQVSDTFKVILTDATSGLALSMCDLTLLYYGEPVSEVTVERHAPDTMLMILDEPLDEGRYTFVVQAVDFAQNIKRDSIGFIYDTTGPVLSFIPGDNSILNQVDQLKVVVWDTLAYRDSIATQFVLRLVDDNNRPISGTAEWFGDTLVFTPSPPLRTDGSDDGLFRIVVEGYDRAGNLTTDSIGFIYDTRPPIVTDARFPTDTLVMVELYKLWAVLNDSLFGRTVSGVNFIASRITLTDQEGHGIPGNLTSNGDTLFLELIDTIDYDGRFTVTFYAEDLAGNGDSIVQPFILDLNPPILVSTVPSDSAFINTPPTEIRALLVDAGSGLKMDTSVTRMQLIAPDSHIVLGHNGFVGDTLVFTIDEAIDTSTIYNGRYTVLLWAEDNIGRTLTGGSEPDTFRFLLDTQKPILVASEPTENAFMNYTLDTFRLYFADPGGERGSGLNLSSSSAGLYYYGFLQDYTISRHDSTIEIVPVDSLEDGRYSIIYNVYDRANNILRDTLNFVIDRVAPLIATSPSDGEFLNRVDTLKAILTDTLAGVDTAQTQIYLDGPHGTIPVNVFWVGDTAVFVPVNPLRTDGSDDGSYQIRVEGYDKAGNGTVYIASFIYDTQAPTEIVSYPTDSLVMDSIYRIWTVVQDGLSGVNPDGSLIRLLNAEDMTAVPGQQFMRGDTLIWEIDSLYAPLADGRYIRYTIASDSAGNRDSVGFNFLVDLYGPELLWTYPGANTFINTAPEVFMAHIVDRGSGLRYDTTTTKIELFAPDGRKIVGAVSIANDTVYFTRLDSLTMDGEYTMLIYAEDNLGRPMRADGVPDTVRFVYDTHKPTIVSSYPARDTALNYLEDSLTILIYDHHAGVDLDASGVVLTYYDTLDIDIQVERIKPDATSDSLGLLVVRPMVTLMDGRYKLVVQAYDRALNLLSDTLPFIYDRDMPILSFLPDSGSMVNRIDVVQSVVSDTLSGVDTSATTLSLTGPNGDVVGEVSWNADTMVFVPQTPFAVGGPDDGLYQLTVNAFDRAGNGIIGRSDFIYDTRPPFVTQFVPEPESIETLTVGYVRAVFSDTFGTRAVSGLNLAASQIALYDANGEIVPGITYYEGDSALRWQLSAPLTLDGRYRIWTLAYDRAGNVDTTESWFTLDLNPPEVVETYPEHLGYVNAQLSVVRAVLHDAGSGVNTSASEISLWTAAMQPVPGQMRAVGDTLYYELSNPLPTDGTADGTYYIHLVSTDYVGTQSHTVEDTFHFIYDTQKPYLVSSMPQDSAVLNIPPAYVQVQLGDITSGVNVGISNLIVVLDDQQIPGDVQRDSAHSTLTFLPYTPFPNGVFNAIVWGYDNAGNAFSDTIVFTVDTVSPSVATDPPNGAKLNELQSVSATFTDELSGVDPTHSYIALSGPHGAIDGDTTWSDATVTFVPSTPLATGGEDDGRYTITAVGYDVAGNSKFHTSTFIYDTRPPEVVSVEPDSLAISSVFEVRAVISDTFANRDVAGVKWSACRIRLYDSDTSTIVPGNQIVHGDTLIWRLVGGLFREGIYVISLHLEDSAGNVRDTATTFVLDFGPPNLVYAYPEPYSYVNQPNLAEILAYVEDVSGGPINFDSSYVEVFDSLGAPVAGHFTVRNDTMVYELTNPFRPDGSDDGRYIVHVHAVDMANNVLDTTYWFIYDVIPPSIDSANPSGITNIRADTLRVWLSDLTSGVDFTASHLVLWFGGTPVVGVVNRVPSASEIQFIPNEPLADGDYLLEVTAHDNAGNELIDTVEFLLDTESPLVWTWPYDGDMVNSVDSVLAVVIGGLSGTDTLNSYIQLSGPHGPVNGLTNWVADTLIFRPIPPLRTDGSDDGRYVIMGAGYDNAGNVSLISGSFIYDTRPPYVVSFYPWANTQYPVVRVYAVVSDSVTGREVSGVDFARSRIRLYDADGRLIPGTQSASGDTLFWVLSDSLIIDGDYTIRVWLWDNADNSDSSEHTFVLDLANPEVVDIDPDSAGFAVDTLRTVRVVFGNAYSGMNYDTTRTRIEVYKGDNVIVPGYHTHSGDTLWLHFTQPLLPNGIYDGYYTLRVYGEDNAGNPLSPNNPYLSYFIFDSRPPHVDSTVPCRNAADYLIRDSVYAYVSDSQPGIDSVSGIDVLRSWIALYYPDGRGVPGYARVYENRLVFFPSPGISFPSGEYAMVVHVVDRAGNPTDDTVRFHVGERMIIADVEPDSGSYVNYLDRASVTIVDRLGIGVDTLGTVFEVRFQDGSQVTGTLTFSGPDTAKTFVLLFDQPLQRTGRYFVHILPRSTDGVYGRDYVYDFLFDNVEPMIVTSFPSDTDTVVGTPERLFVTVSDLSGIDTVQTRLSLFDPAGNSIPGHTEFVFGGKSADTIAFVPEELLMVEGTYRFVPYIVDLAGNVLIDTMEFTFYLPIGIRTVPAEGDTVRFPLTEVHVIAKDRRGFGIQSVIDVQLIRMATLDTLACEPTAFFGGDSVYVICRLTDTLAVDGSDNGDYTIRSVFENVTNDTVEGHSRFTYLVDIVPPGVPILSPPPPTEVWYDTITVQGLAEPFSMVFVVVNDSFRDSTIASYDSSFVFYRIPLVFDTVNTLKFFAVDAFGNVSDTLEWTIKAAPPEFSVVPSKPFTETNHKFLVSVPEDARVTLKIYNLRGDFVWETECDVPMGKDIAIDWDMRNREGHDVNNGPYLFILKAKYADGREDVIKDIIMVVK